MVGPINMNDVRRGHAEFLAQTEALFKNELWKAGDVAVRSVKTTDRFKRRSVPSIKDVTRYKVSGSNRKLTLRITSPRKHAIFLEKGTRPHPIVARRKQFLRFRYPGGPWIFRRRVFHPGTRPTFFLRTATQEAYASFGERVRYKMQRQRFRFRSR